MGKVLGIVNRKGGVGKTTTATTLSYLLSKEGCKVALIDFDGQRHTTKLCGVTAPEQEQMRSFGCPGLLQNVPLC